MKKTNFKPILVIIMASFWVFSTVAQEVELPEPDEEGWIYLFRGDNQQDFSVYTGTGAPSDNPREFGPPFFVEGEDIIRTSGSPNGQLIFRKNFSHYIMQVDLRWPRNLGNTGVMTKIQYEDDGQGDGLPRAVECQGDPNQGIGQIWALGSIDGRSGGTWVNVRARMVNHPFGGGQAAQADSTQPEIAYGGVGAPSNNLIIGYPGWQRPRPAALDNNDWITIEVESHGHDTSRHFVNGELVMEYHSPRIAPRNDADNVIKYLTEGMLSVQSEGTEVWYRNWRIKLLPEDPLYDSLYNTDTTTAVLGPAAKQPSNGLGYELGFNGSLLKILTEGRQPYTLTGRKLPFRQAP